MTTLTAGSIRQMLDLKPHPEGGWYRETYRSPHPIRHPLIEGSPPRCFGTAIYFLLEAGNISAFHSVRSDEVWHWYAGGALELYVLHPDGWHEEYVLGTDIAAGQRPQVAVAAGAWQGARPAPGAAFALCGCTVSPGFEFADFELPRRAKLKRLFPQYSDLIDSLTHPE